MSSNLYLSETALRDGWEIITLAEDHCGDVTTHHVLTKAIPLTHCPACGQTTGRTEPVAPLLSVNDGQIGVGEDICHGCAAPLSMAIPWRVVDPRDTQEIDDAMTAITTGIEERFGDPTMPCRDCGATVHVTVVDGSIQETDGSGRVVCDDCAD